MSGFLWYFISAIAALFAIQLIFGVPITDSAGMMALIYAAKALGDREG